MILIADSGGSKLDWRLLYDDATIDQAYGPGFNPYYQPASHLLESIQLNLLPKVKQTVAQIYFYGAGVSSDANQEIVRSVLLQCFPEAQIEINWDLLAAARSLCGHEPGIACILGTGSNSCFYDGLKITRNIPTVGWVLGDEGGGAHMGKRLVNDFMRHDMPEELRDKFYKEFSLDREQILAQVYQQEKPSTFLGSFTKYILQQIKEPYYYRLVYSSFEEFFTRNVMKYENYKEVKVHFTGSVAFHFSNLLRQVGNDMGVNVRNIVEGPIAGLVLFHQQALKQIR